RRPMHLIQIDRVHTETAQAVFALLAYRFGAEVLMNLAGFVPAQNTLCENIRSRPRPLAESASDDFLGMAHSVNRCRINPIHAELKRPMDRRNRVRIFLMAPRKFPTRASDGPGAKTHRGDGQIRMAQFARLHEPTSEFANEETSAIVVAFPWA